MLPHSWAFFFQYLGFKCDLSLSYSSLRISGLSYTKRVCLSFFGAGWGVVTSYMRS